MYDGLAHDRFGNFLVSGTERVVATDADGDPCEWDGMVLTTRVMDPSTKDDFGDCDSKEVPVPAHYSRRCSNPEAAVIKGVAYPCTHRFSFKMCPDCLAENDIAARHCTECKIRLVDPNEKLTEKAGVAGIMAEALARLEPTEEGRIEAAAYSHVQGYFKRLRKAGCRFRYAAIPEYGEENGRLHYHVLIHETEPQTCLYRILDTKWRSFVQANLVRSPKGAASYAAKYLTKSLSRIRASERYGTNEPSPMRSNQEELLMRLLRIQQKKSGLTYPPLNETEIKS